MSVRRGSAKPAIAKFAERLKHHRTVVATARAVAADKERLPELLLPVVVDCVVRGAAFDLDIEVHNLARARFGMRQRRRRLTPSRESEARSRVAEMELVEQLMSQLNSALDSLVGAYFLRSADVEPHYAAALSKVTHLPRTARLRCLEELLRSRPTGLSSRTMKSTLFRLVDRAMEFPVGRAERLYYAVRSVRKYQRQLAAPALGTRFAVSAIKAHLSTPEGKAEVQHLARQKAPQVYEELVRRELAAAAKRRGQARAVLALSGSDPLIRR